jgi:FixJ family two-component response regulator
MLMTGAETLVCIVDDDLSVRRGLGRLIYSYGFQTMTFSSAREYLDAYEGLNVACLVLDVHLGGMTGFELLEKLRSRGVATPVIVITAYDEAASEQRAKRSGAVEYLRKPLDGAVVFAAIARALDPDFEDTAV